MGHSPEIELPNEPMPARLREDAPIPECTQKLPPRPSNLTMLPLESLGSFDIFEQLIHRLLMRLIDFKSPKRYGLPGSSQPGFDLYAVRRSRPETGLTAWECKSWTKKPFNHSALKKGVDRFIKRGFHNWVSELIFVVPQFGLKDRLSKSHIEQQARLRDLNVDLDIWSADEICAYLKPFPDIVETFFSPDWANAFCTKYTTQWQGLEENIASSERSGRVDAADAAAHRSTPKRKYFGRVFRWSSGRLSLEGLRPIPGHESISCLMRLEESGISGCALTLSGKELLETLVTGFSSDPSSETRGFVVHAPNQYSDKYTVQIGNARIWLGESDIRDLCAAVDSWCVLVRASYRRLIQTWDARGYQVVPEDRRVRLGSISRDAWHLLLQFARAHDYEAGDSEWHILDGRSSAILVFAPEKRGTLSPGYHLHITGFSSARGEVDLWWHPPMRDHGISPDEYWGAATAHRWLLEKLIPATFHWALVGGKPRTLLDRLFRRTGPRQSEFEKLTLDELSRGYQPFPSKHRQQALGGDFEPIARAIHRALDANENWHLPLPKDSIHRIAEAVSICLEVWRGEHLDYISSKLDLSAVGDPAELRRELAEIHMRETSEEQLEHPFRAFIDAAAKTCGRLGGDRTAKILDILAPFIRHADAIHEIELISHEPRSTF